MGYLNCDIERERNLEKEEIERKKNENNKEWWLKNYFDISYTRILYNMNPEFGNDQKFVKNIVIDSTSNLSKGKSFLLHLGISKEIKEDINFMKECCEINPFWLYKCNETLKKDKDFVFNLIKDNIEVYFRVDHIYETDKDIIKYILESSENSFLARKIKNKEVFENREILLLALNKNFFFEYKKNTIPKKFIEDKEILLKFISQSCNFFKEFETLYQYDLEFLKECVKVDPFVYKLLSIEMQQNKEIIELTFFSDDKKEFTFKSSIFKWLSEELINILLEDEEFVLKLLNNNYEISKFLPLKYKDRKDIIELCKNIKN